MSRSARAARGASALTESTHHRNRIERRGGEAVVDGAVSEETEKKRGTPTDQPIPHADNQRSVTTSGALRPLADPADTTPKGGEA